MDVIRESLASHPTRPPHQIWLPPLEVSRGHRRIGSALAGQALACRLRHNPGLTFPIGIEDIPEDHAQEVYILDAQMDNVMVVGAANGVSPRR